jgi:hypothetical protein
MSHMTFRASPEEVERIRRQAQEAGMDASAFIRARCLSPAPTRQQPKQTVRPPVPALCAPADAGSAQLPTTVASVCDPPPTVAPVPPAPPPGPPATPRGVGSPSAPDCVACRRLRAEISRAARMVLQDVGGFGDAYAVPFHCGRLREILGQWT